MKKCPTCDKTFEDSMRFCQIDGTPLVDDAPAFDPYATIVSSPVISTPPAAELEVSEIVEPAVEVVEPEPVAVAVVAPPEPVEIPAAAPIAEPDDVLDLPENDPLKTMYVSDAEMRDALRLEAPVAEEPVMELPKIEKSIAAEPPMAEEYAAPEQPSFLMPDVPAPGFGDVASPPSPFSALGSVVEEPKPAAPMFDEAATIIQQPVSFNPPAPVAEWTPPPAPDANWQKQEIGSNTPFQPPPAGTGSLNQTLPIVSLVLGILSICCPLGAVTGPAAIVTGFLGMKNVNNDPQTYGGKGLAIAGMAVGGLFFILSIIWWILQIIGMGLGSLNRF